MRVRCNRPEDLAAIEKAPVAPGGLGGAVVWRDQLIKSHLIYPHHCTVGGLDPPVCPGKSGAGTGPPPTPHCYPSPTPSPARRCSADLLCCRWWYWWDRVAPVHGEHKRRGRTRATDGRWGGGGACLGVPLPQGVPFRGVPCGCPGSRRWGGGGGQATRTTWPTRP